MRIGKKWFGENGQIYKEIENQPGVRNIAALIENYSTRNDQWLIFEQGGSSLSKMLFDVKGEFYKGERIYAVRFLFIKNSHPSS